MAKSEKKNDTKKAKQNKSESIIDDVKGRVTATHKELQKQVDELNKQIKSMRKEIEKPALKLIDNIEKRYQAQLKKAQKEFDERITQVHKAQEKILNALPQEISKHLSALQIPKPSAKTSTRATAANAANKLSHELDQIRGIGPVLVDKLKEAGITSLHALSNPSETQQKALEAFKQTRGYSSWKKQADEILAKLK